MDPGQVMLVAVIGLAAGLLGGLAGIGGSMIMIPGLALLLGYDDLVHSEHHVYMAAAMVVNVLVAVPAAVHHHRARSVRADLARLLMPAMSVAIVAGVLVSNLLRGEVLRIGLAAFIGAYCLVNIKRIIRPVDEATRPPERRSRPLFIGIGGAAGLVGGVLGLGGGVVMVPMLQVLGRVRLRPAIGTSSAVMVITALIGAALKLLTLAPHGRTPAEALWLALFMGPTAVLGAGIGAQLTHMLPVRAVRAVVTALLLFAAARMAGLF